MCLAQGPQRSDAGEARTRGHWFSSPAVVVVVVVEVVVEEVVVLQVPLLL